MTKYLFILFLLLSVNAFAGTQTLPPTAVSAETNFSVTCVLSAIDEDPDSTDGTWCVASADNVNTTLRVDFATPTNPPQDGADLQEARVLFRPFDAGNTGDPTCVVDIYNGGSLDANTSCSSASPFTIDNTAGEQIASCTWDSVDLDTNDGSTVQIHTVCTTKGSGGNANAGDHGAVEWNANTAPASYFPGYPLLFSETR